MTSDTLFGAPLNSGPQQRLEWTRVLTRLWVDFAGRLPGALDKDLQVLSKVFGHGTSAKTVRKRVADLPISELEQDDVPPECALFVDGCALITPEGRILLEVLMTAQSQHHYGISPEIQRWALQAALHARAAWYQSWIAKQFDGQLSAPALAAALFLLVNGSVGARNALLLPRDPDRDIRLGSVVLPILGEFGAALNRKDKLDRETGLRGNWAFTQISRYLRRDIGREADGEDSGTLIFVREGREASLLNAVAERVQKLAPLSARQRAVDAFLREYRAARPPLAALGLVHEDPTVTQRVTQRLLGDQEDL